ncbi:MAG: hypothetical protein PHS37_09250 [Candidatus Omnitrophica bacterium]|nr:hypothetical protein [Candidatus Omnitrophota bacterium]
MGIFQAIGKGFAESLKFLKVIALFFVFNFVIGLIMLPFASPQNANNPRVALISVGVSIIAVLVFIFLQGGALALIRDLLKKGACSMGDFMSYGAKYYIPILGLFIIVVLIALVVILLVAIVAAGIFAVANNAVTKAVIIGIVALLAIIAAVLLLFPIYAIIVDEVGPVAAIKRGISASLKAFWKTLAFLLILFLATFGIAFAIGTAAMSIAGVLPLKVGQVITIFVNSILQSYLSVVMMIALMVFYLALGTSRQPGKGPASIAPNQA